MIKTKKEFTEELVGSTIYVGDMENYAVITGAELHYDIDELDSTTETGEMVIGEVWIKYREDMEPESHDIFFINDDEDENWRTDAYICHIADITEDEDMQELEHLFMHEFNL